MALVLKDRVKETTTTTGTGTYTLAGAVTGFEAFSEVGDGNTTYYACTDGTDFEVGIGTYTSSGTTLARTTILQSSNSDSAVNWTSGTRTIFCTMPAEKAVFLNADGDIEFDTTHRIKVTSNGNDAVLDIAGGGPNFIRFRPDSVFSNIADGVDIKYRTTPNDLLIERSENNNIIAEFGGDDGHAALYYDNAKKLETTSAGVDVTGDATISGDLFVNGGTIRSEDGTLDFGDNSADNWGQISYQSGADINGFSSQFDNAIRFSNEQGSTNQHMLVLDTDANNSANLWGVSVNDTPIFGITGQSHLKMYHPNGASNSVTISPTTPTANRTITLPDATGTVLLADGDGSSLTSVDAATLDSLDSTQFLRSDAADSFSQQIDGTTLELAGGVTYDPPGSTGIDTATDVGLALHSGARVVMGTSGFIRTIIDATASQPLQFGQSGTGYFAGTNIFGGAQGVKLHYNADGRMLTTSDGISVLSSDDNGPVINLISNDPADVADFTTEAQIKFFAENDASEQTQYATIFLSTGDVTDGTEDGWMYFQTMHNGSLTNTAAVSPNNFYLLNSDSKIIFNNWGGTSHSITLTPSTPTADRTITLPDKSGTVAMTSDISEEATALAIALG